MKKKTPRVHRQAKPVKYPTKQSLELSRKKSKPVTIRLSFKDIKLINKAAKLKSSHLKFGPYTLNRLVREAAVLEATSIIDAGPPKWLGGKK